MAFHKNSYVGRTFIKPQQKQRVSSVKIKLSVISEVVKGKRIVMVDDSIVRGTTSANIIKMLKAAGATEVIETAEHPVNAIRRKKDSSMVVAMNLVKAGEADAFFSYSRPLLSFRVKSMLFVVFSERSASSYMMFWA